MKNFYTSMMALACAGTMFAQLSAPKSDIMGKAFPSLSPVKTELTNSVNKAYKSSVPFIKDFKAAPASAVSRAASRALGTEIDWDTTDPTTLEYDSIGVGYFYDSYFTGLEIETPVYEAKEYPGVYRYDLAWSGIAGNEAQPLYIDASDPDMIIIPTQNTGIQSTTDGPLQVLNQAEFIRIFNNLTYAEVYDIVVDEEVNMYVPDNNPALIYMPPMSFVGYFPEAANQDEAMFALNNDEMYALVPNPEWKLIPQWADPQPCKIYNSMILGAFDVNVTEQETTMQYNNWYDGTYLRVLSPYKDLGFNGSSLEMSISIPECVIVGYQGTGIQVTGRGNMYVMSRANLYESLEDFQASEDAPYAITIDENRKITFPASSMLFNFPQFGDGTDLYIYNTPVGYIELVEPYDGENVGVKDIESDVIDVNAPKTYYNLQGVQVANPTAGQIYIVKQGNKVTKQVIR